MIIFAGPSIAGLDSDAIARLDVRDPVQQGDVFLATLEKPQAIGIIDGYFEGAPAVWHKEILWAMSQGIAVLGAASMGALRAAELDVFGMVGVGKIYHDYASSRLEDDDEVALLHGPRELGYPSLSLAMVNVRAILAAAAHAEIISKDQSAYLTEIAKAQFYKTRTWETIFAAVDPEKFPRLRLAKLQTWLEENTLDQKQSDAALLLDRMRAGNFERPQTDFHFEETTLWISAQKTWHARRKQAPDAGHQLFADRELLGG